MIAGSTCSGVLKVWSAIPFDSVVYPIVWNAAAVVFVIESAPCCLEFDIRCWLSETAIVHTPLRYRSFAAVWADPSRSRRAHSPTITHQAHFGSRAGEVLDIVLAAAIPRSRWQPANVWSLKLGPLICMVFPSPPVLPIAVCFHLRSCFRYPIVIIDRFQPPLVKLVSPRRGWFPELPNAWVGKTPGGFSLAGSAANRSCGLF